MVTAYCIVAGITFTIVISAFLKDRDAQADTTAWLFMAAATLLWPITLPFILRKKFQAKAPPKPLAGVQSPEDFPQESEASPVALPTPQTVSAQTVSATRDA